MTNLEGRAVAALQATLDGADWVAPPGLIRPVLIRAMMGLRAEAVARLRKMGLSEGQAEDSFGDIDRKQSLYSDLVDDSWLIWVLTGRVVKLGRLQFEWSAGSDGRAIHVPEQGPLAPASVDASLAAAQALFGPSAYTCQTWLFDPHLLELPARSNIRQFVDRFDIEPSRPTVGGAADAAKFAFVARLPEVSPTPAASDTGLQRIVRRALAAEGVWSVPLGHLPG